ncbi:50S ribosomal protein L4 [Candidatus Deianiraea vastatrix]|uniref:Large ribosomal subunit protein uL4 n=1 Tax=Candidatus Deianiraea vastatrix TaxID=2163644 RepID=A0A5B8XCT3_9RICK|nr:50S ribosomal protein L4 [Candidatus Deianiraea vastatrix]QED23189.1 50S ribosomal protein L4 [Candidatus Deianiraea vastatrix]
MLSSNKFSHITVDFASVSEPLKAPFLNEYLYDMNLFYNSSKPLAHTKDISEVSATGKKPFKQKGTGSARQGSKVSAQHRGGGIAHGPRAKRYTSSMNSKAVKKAKRMAIGYHCSNSSIFSIQCSGEIEKPKTKYIVDLIKSLNLSPDLGMILFITSEPKTSNFYKSARNIKNVVIKSPSSASVHDLFKAKAVVLFGECFNEFSVVLSK